MCESLRSLVSRTQTQSLILSLSFIIESQYFVTGSVPVDKSETLGVKLSDRPDVCRTDRVLFPPHPSVLDLQDSTKRLQP